MRNMTKNMARVALAIAAILTAAVCGAAEPSAKLTVYTFRTPGICPACDAARPVSIRAARVYPLEFVYRDDPRGAARCMAAGVDRFPTFILETTDATGATREAARWSGANDLARKIRAAFRLKPRAESAK